MAAKGTDVRIDIPKLNELIVATSNYRNTIKDKVETIRIICKAMEENETLKGGDGDAIREAFATIGKGCTELNTSAQYIVQKLEDKLSGAITLRHGVYSGDAIEQAKKSTANIAAYKKS